MTTLLRTDGEVEVLNGTVRAGDMVAYAVRNGNAADIVMGKVIGFEDHMGGSYHRPGKTVTRIKVEVHKRSGWRSDKAITGVERHDRVVKLNVN